MLVHVRPLTFLSSIVTGNTWAAIGGTIVVALYNGGPPGVLFEL